MRKKLHHSNSEIVAYVRLFYSPSMDYTEWKAIAKQNKLTVSAISKTAGYSRDAIQRACERNDGQVPERFILILEAVIHRKNKRQENLSTSEPDETNTNQER